MSVMPSRSNVSLAFRVAGGLLFFAGITMPSAAGAVNKPQPPPSFHDGQITVSVGSGGGSGSSGGSSGSNGGGGGHHASDSGHSNGGRSNGGGPAPTTTQCMGTVCFRYYRDGSFAGVANIAPPTEVGVPRPGPAPAPSLPPPADLFSQATGKLATPVINIDPNPDGLTGMESKFSAAGIVTPAPVTATAGPRTKEVVVKRGPLKWTFGDGTSTTGVTVGHTYETKGDKIVRLDVTWTATYELTFNGSRVDFQNLAPYTQTANLSYGVREVRSVLR